MSRYRWSTKSLAVRAELHPALVRVFDRALSYGLVDYCLLRGLRDKDEQRRNVENGVSITFDSRHLPGGAWDPPPDCEHPDKAYATDFCVWVSGRGFVEEERELAFAAALLMRAAQEEGVDIRWGGDWDSDGDQHDSTFYDAEHVEIRRR